MFSLKFCFTGDLLPSLSLAVSENPGSRKYASVLRALKAENPVHKLEVIENWIYGFLSRSYHLNLHGKLILNLDDFGCASVILPEHAN